MSELFSNMLGYNPSIFKNTDVNNEKNQNFSEVDFCLNAPEDNFFAQEYESFDVDFGKVDYQELNFEKEYAIDQFKRDYECIEMKDYSDSSWEFEG